MQTEASKKTRFKKGDDPRRNTTGKNKGKRWLTTLLVEALQNTKEGKETYDQLLTKRVLKKAIAQGDNRMIELIYTRIEGNATTPVEDGTVEKSLLDLLRKKK